MGAKPLVSVIMPAYNAEDYVARAIESVLDQSLKDIELIVVNDASNDDTASIAKKYAKRDKRIRLVNNKRNLKISGSLNKGMKMAKAKLVARMDADDISHPKRLELQHNLLKRKPEVAVVGANMIIINKRGKAISKREYPTTSQELKKVMFRYSPFAHPVVMYRKKVLEEFGGYSGKMVPCEDIDLWFKVGSKYDFASINKPLLKYTLIKTSSSHSKLKDLELLNFKIRLNAIIKYGFKPSAYDICYNIAQFLTVWIMPASLRIWLYNLLRSNRLI